MEPAPPPIQRAPDDLPYKLNLVIVLAIFALLIGLALVSFFGVGQPEEASEPSFTLTETELKTAFMPEALQSLSPQASATAGNVDKSLEGIYEKVEPRASESDHAARLTLVIGYELEKEADPEALERLYDGSEEDQDFATLYVTAGEQDGGYSALAPEGSDQFSDRLAQMHAAELDGDPDARGELISMATYAPVLGAGVMMVGAAGLGVVVLLLAFLAIKGGKWPAIGYPPTAWDTQAMEAPNAARRLARMSLFLMLFIFVPTIISLALQKLLPTIVATALSMFGLLIATVLMLGIPLGGVKDGFVKMMGRTDQIGRLSLIGVAGFLGNLPLILFSSFMVQFVTRLFPNMPEPSHPLNDVLSNDSALMTVGFSLLVAAVFAPLVEELTFRGLLFPGLTKAMPVVWAMVLQGFLFAAVHPQGPAAWLMLGLIGFTASFLAWRTGSLIPAIVMHAVHNAFILTFGLLFLA